LSHTKVLIVSEVPLGAPNGFGVTLKNLFTGWPREQIRYFYNSADYRKLAKANLDFRYAPVPNFPSRRHAIPMWLGITPEWRGKYSKTWLRRNLRGFMPDIVFSSVHSMATICFADWISEQIGRHHVLHVMDEPFKHSTATEVKILLQKTRGFLTISETMRQTYRERYGHESQVFHNGAEKDFFTPPPRQETKNDPPIRIRFIGNLLHLQHFQSIEDIAGAVRQFNKIGNRRAVLEIFGGESPEGCSHEILHKDEVIYHGRIDLEDRLKTLADADLLVIPFTFSPSYFEEYRLSIPTKLPENLATGIPVLLYGPRGMAATDLCFENDLATVLTKRSVPDLLHVLKKLAENPKPFQEKAEKAQKFAQREFSVIKTSERFQNLLKEMVD
jgi:glycosyltransferase involved in cell wall biosynthesis